METILIIVGGVVVYKILNNSFYRPSVVPIETHQFFAEQPPPPLFGANHVQNIRRASPNSNVWLVDINGATYEVGEEFIQTYKQYD